MSKVHQCDVWRLDMPSVHHQIGELIDVAGEQMVRLGHGVIVPARGQWHGTIADAKREAARKVDAMITRMHGLAAQLRAEADAEGSSLVMDAAGGVK